VVVTVVATQVVVSTKAVSTVVVEAALVVTEDLNTSNFLF